MDLHVSIQVKSLAEFFPLQCLQSQTSGLKTKGCPLSPPAVNEELLTKVGESKVAGSALGVLLATGAGMPLPGSLVGHPSGSSWWVTQAHENP